jgi:hypothetical protein
MFLNIRGALQFALSQNSMKEVDDAGNREYLYWAYELLDYWHGCLASYNKASHAFSGRGILNSKKLLFSKFGYLSKKDKKLIMDACYLECDIFLTMDKRLAANCHKIEQELGILVLLPIELLNLLKPWIGLLP